MYRSIYVPSAIMVKNNVLNNTCPSAIYLLKLTIETLGQDVKYVQS